MKFQKWSRDSSVGIATVHGLYDRGVGVRIPVGAKNFTSPLRPDRFRGSPSLLSNGYRGFLPRGYIGRDVKLTIHLQLVPRSIHPLPNTPSYRNNFTFTFMKFQKYWNMRITLKPGVKRLTFVCREKLQFWCSKKIQISFYIPYFAFFALHAFRILNCRRMLLAVPFTPSWKYAALMSVHMRIEIPPPLR
jgi:hypothetical protein